VNTREHVVHYGCHEVREDAERVISGRVDEAVHVAYFAHVDACDDCRRFHRVLEAVYVGPERPAVPDAAQEREFANIMARVEGRPAVSRGSSRERATPLRFIAPLAVGLCAAASLLVLSLVVPQPHGLEVDLGEPTVFGATPVTATIPDDVGGLGHRSQSFGRVIAGDGSLSVADRSIASEIFAEGTRFEIDGEEAMQVGLVGKVLASFEPGTTGEWTSASSSLIELGVERGLVAVRYDRKPADPVLQIRTPTALVRVIGTVFTVAVADDGRTIVSVLRGKVEVLHPEDQKRIAEVEAGYRFDVEDSTYADLGRPEVAAALPLAGDSDTDIPTNWAVPGLPEDSALRTLAQVVDPTAGARHPKRKAPRTRPRTHETEDLMAKLIAEVENSRLREVHTALERCRDLYADPETRFRAAQCLTRFMQRYGHEEEAVEGLLLIGILRMDFAHDYQSATLYFEDYLRRAPEHANVELARYKLVIASVEAGKIADGRKRAEDYLGRYPDGRHVGQILQRFPELKSRI
jgi:hypothetical protein